MSTDIRHIWCGGHIQKPAVNLKAGAVSLLYENGSIRYITAGKNEIIRMVYSAVRDKVWQNVKPVITYERIDRSSGSFRIEYKCNYSDGEIKFTAWYQIEGKQDGTITFILDGEALSTFEKNRIGFCILHPVEGLSGKSCSITHSDGIDETSSFPQRISSRQVFTDIRAMKWNIHGIDCSLEFSGDIFETEDQRNWTDASYKTYSTPLGLPLPAKLEKGTRIHQKVIFKANISGQQFEEDNGIINISVQPDSSYVLPKIGIGRSTRIIPLDKNEKEILQNIKFDHYRCDIYLFDPEWTKNANTAKQEASELGYLLELALFFDDNYILQAEDLRNWIIRSEINPSAIAIYHKTVKVTPSSIAGHVIPILKKIIPQTLICCGTNANFEQVNSDRPDEGNYDLLSYSIHPQEHASDNITLIENLKAQAYTVESAKLFSGSSGIWVSPVNIQRRFNANIENYEKSVDDGSMPYQIDSRIMSLFGACWTAGSLKYLGESGISGITYFETAGERGIIQGNISTQWTNFFRSFPGKLFPVYHLFRWLLEDKSFSIIKSTSSLPLNTDVLALSNGSYLKLAIFNTGVDNRSVQLSGVRGSFSRICLETDTFESAGNDSSWIYNAPVSEFKEGDSLILSPYSVTFLEGPLLNQ